MPEPSAPPARGGAPRKDRTYRVVIWLIRRAFTVVGLRIRIEGLERIPASGPAIVVANHTSYLDFTFLGLVGFLRGRLVRFLAKESTFDNRVSGPLMRAMGHISVRRPVGTAAALQTSRALASGELVGIFPEATISRSWTIKPMRRGAAYLAVAHGVPVIPVVTWGGQRVFTVGGRVDLRRGTVVSVLVGEPLVPAPGEAVADLDARLRASLTSLLDRVQAAYPQHPRGDDDRWWLPRHLGGTAPTLEEAAEIEAVRDAKRLASQQERDRREEAGRVRGT